MLCLIKENLGLLSSNLEIFILLDGLTFSLRYLRCLPLKDTLGLNNLKHMGFSLHPTYSQLLREE